MNLRQQQADTTRQAIVDAFRALMREENAVTVSVPAVARRAGVSVRTLYRYFPNKDELQNAAANLRADQAKGRHRIDLVGPRDLLPFLETMWKDFACDVPAIAAEHHTPIGRQMRTARLATTRAEVAQVAPELDAVQIDLIVAAISSSMFLELVDRMGHDPATAARMAAWLVELIRTHPYDEPHPTEEHR